MPKFLEKILVVVNPVSDIQPSVLRGEMLAMRFNASLELFICDYDQHLGVGGRNDARSLSRARDEYVERGRRQLRQLASNLDTSEVKVTVECRWDYPLADGILRKIKDSNADLILKDTHFERAICRTLFSNTDWTLIRRCPIPLWLVKPNPLPSGADIIVALDPMHASGRTVALDRELLAWGDRLAAGLQGTVCAFHAYDMAAAFAASIEAIGLPIASPLDSIAASVRFNHESEMQKLLSRCTPRSRYDTAMIEGDTRTALVDTISERQSALVVMGAVSRSFLQRAVLGSTAEQVLDHLPCDLLVVKPPHQDT